MSSTPQPLLTPDDRAFLQRIINLYHRRLLAAWKSVTGGTEAVPASHVNPPSIADWSNDKIKKVLENFNNHLEWYSPVDKTIQNLLFQGDEINLIFNGFILLEPGRQLTDDFLTRVSSMRLVEWESCDYPTLKPRWDKLRMEREKAGNENKPAGGGNEE
ncbi:hypothetical protein EDC01DRAFT_784195 [Geopyxis carbonaria]|nr:hypothetical protein EDC01DRAFT_784195 [Geopyxis carbonaria]